MTLVLTIMLPVIATTGLAAFGYATRRILSRIDSIGEQMLALATRVSVIETKQDMAVAAAIRTDRVTRKTASKVGVYLPRELTDTLDPTRRPRPVTA